MQSLAISKMRSLAISVPAAPTRALYSSVKGSLSDFTQTATRLEDAVVFSLWERSLYSPHKHAYGATSRSPSFGSAPGSILDSLLVRIEHLRALSGFYCLHDDMPFNPHALPKSTDALIPPPVRPVPIPLDPRGAKINMTGSIWWRYLNIITQLVSPQGGDDDDGLLAHCLFCDIKCLQAISRRVHFFKFIAEGKFLESSPTFVEAWSIEDKGTKRERIGVALGWEEGKRDIEERYGVMADEFVDLDIPFKVCASIYLGNVQRLVEVMELLYIYKKMQRK
ncbi:hypothetical protein K1719_013090 [Acacia pycnantha]|nr:hypothetical protein K1719_013090 [Acacia pycnantha]